MSQHRKIISTITILYTILILYFLFLGFFFLSILLMETIQALTLLGSFDVNDAIRNSLGAAVGFGAYKLGVRSKNGWRNIVITAISCMVLLLGGWGLCGIVDKAFTKEEGPYMAINELKDSSGNSLTLHDIFFIMVQDPTSKEGTDKLIQIANETFLKD